MEHKGYHIEEERGEFEIYESREAWISGRPPMHGSESEQEARDWIDREIQASAGELIHGHMMWVLVNPGEVWIDVADWCRDHKGMLESAISNAVKGLGFAGKVHVEIRY